jgi:hypothetical protein
MVEVDFVFFMELSPLLRNFRERVTNRFRTYFQHIKIARGAVQPVEHGDNKAPYAMEGDRRGC